MKSALINYDGMVEEALNRLIEQGIFKSKSDAFRVGIVELAAKYGAVKTKEDMIDEMMYHDALPEIKKLKSGKARLVSLDSLD